MSRRAQKRPDFPEFCPDQENVQLRLEVRENDITVHFTTHKRDGYISFQVPWSLRQMRKYANPDVFEELIERLFPVKTNIMGYNCRADLEAAAHRSRRNIRKVDS